MRKIVKGAVDALVRARLRKPGTTIGPGVSVKPSASVTVLRGGTLEIGRDTRIARGVVIRVAEGARLTIGERAVINQDVRLDVVGTLSIGDDCLINSYGMLYCEGQMVVGNDVLMGPWVFLADVTHRFDSTEIPIRLQGLSKPAPIIIQEDAWLGARVSVSPGVTIGKGAVIGANAVVTKDVPPGSVAAGVPARVVKNRFPADDDIPA